MKTHYTDVHRVDEKNNFFTNLFTTSNNLFCKRKCLRCDDFLPTTYYKKTHDFLILYGSGRNAFEEKPVKYFIIGEIQLYDITIREHSRDYDFYHSESLVDDFLLNVKNRIKRSNNDIIIKSGFSIENIHLFPSENEKPIVNYRYWSTEIGKPILVIKNIKTSSNFTEDALELSIKFVAFLVFSAIK